MKTYPNLLKRSGIKSSGYLALTDEGLMMSTAVTTAVRHDALWMETDRKRERIDERAAKRSDLQIVINPDWIELSPLMAYFQAHGVAHKDTAQVSALRDGEKQQTYERGWKTIYLKDENSPDSFRHLESQQLYLVGFQDAKPVGFVKVRPEIYQFPNGDVDLDIQLDMAYVSPKLRGKGFGVDLAVATGNFITELMGYVHDGCNAQQKLQVHIAAEAISARGQMFLDHVATVTKTRLEELDDDPRIERESIRGFTCHP